MGRGQLSKNARRGVAAAPKYLDEMIKLFGGGERFELGALLRSDNPADILVEPLLVGLAELDLEALGVLLLLFFPKRALEWIGLLVVLSGSSLVFGLVLVVLPEGSADQAQNCCETRDQKTPTETYLGHDGGTPY